MPPKKPPCSIVINFATRTIIINGTETRCPTHIVEIESEGDAFINWKQPSPAPITHLIPEYKAFESEMQPYLSYGIKMERFYQMLLHADTIRKITLIRTFPGLTHEYGVVEKIVQLMFSHNLVTVYRGGYRKTGRCMERLQKLADPSEAPVGTHEQYTEKKRKKEREWYGDEEFEKKLNDIFSNTELDDSEIAKEIRVFRAEAIRRKAPQSHISRLDEEIKNYTTKESEIDHVKKQAKEVANESDTDHKRMGRGSDGNGSHQRKPTTKTKRGSKKAKRVLPRKSEKEVYLDEEEE